MNAPSRAARASRSAAFHGPACPRCSDLAPATAITCPGCGYWPLREPSDADRLDRQLAKLAPTIREGA